MNQFTKDRQEVGFFRAYGRSMMRQGQREVEKREAAKAAEARSVTKSEKRTSHGFHLLATICTGGAWAPIWAGMTVWHKLGPRAKHRTKTQLPYDVPVARSEQPEEAPVTVTLDIEEQKSPNSGA
jgi:hypothetical protein